MIVNTAFLQHIQCRIRPPDKVDIFKWYRTWFFTRDIEFNSRLNVITKNNFQRSSKNRFWLHRHPLACLTVETLVEVIIVFFVSCRIILSWGGSSENLISSRQRDRSICERGYEHFSPFFGMRTSLALSLRAWISDVSKFCSSSMSATMMSPFQILPAFLAYHRKILGKTLLTSWWSLNWSFADIGWYSIIDQKGIMCPLNGSPNRRS